MSTRARMLWLQRMQRVAVRILIDVVLIAGAMALAFWLRFEGAIPARMTAVLWREIVLAIGIKIPILFAFRAYRIRWRHVGLGDLVATATACLVGTSMLATLVYLLHGVPLWGAVPRSVLGIDLAFSILALAGVRLSPRVLGHAFSRTRSRGRRSLLVGVGDAGAALLRALESDPAYAVVGILDDDPAKWGLRIRGVPVLGARDRMQQFARRQRVLSVLIAMPSAPAAVIRETVELARGAGITDIKIVPQLSELYTGRVTPETLRAVRLEDLLHRDPVSIDASLVETYLTGRTVLVTGAAGSIGSELCRQILRFGAARLVAVDFNETGLFDLESALRNMFGDRSIEVIIADVRDAAEMKRIVDEASPHVVYHAAAYKHVPLMESFPAEAVKTNVFGTRNVLTAACEAECDAFVLISTDKAVNPTSVMGASKRVAEMIVHAQQRTAGTRCTAVRFGNVLGSRGSVLHTFQEQIENRRPLTITHPDMRRYFMMTSEAVQLVLQAGVVGKNGQVLVLDMGEPVRILDLAHDVIRFHGLEPDVDVPISIIGLRPGEKLFEELLTAEEGTDATSYDKVFVARLDSQWQGPAFDAALETLRDAAQRGTRQDLVACLCTLIPSYTPDIACEDPAGGSRAGGD